jgi:hypothetical protein
MYQVPVCINSIGCKVYTLVTLVATVPIIIILVSPPAVLGRVAIDFADLTRGVHKGCRSTIIAMAHLASTILAVVIIMSMGAITTPMNMHHLGAHSDHEIHRYLLLGTPGPTIGAATIRTIASWTVVMVRLVTAAGDVGRGGEAFLGPVAKAIAHVIGVELPEEFIERRVWLTIDEGVVLILVETMKQVPDQLVLVKGLANHRQFGGKPLHLGVVVVGCHSQLLGVIELAPKMLDLGASRCLEHVVNRRPGLSG